MTASPQFGLGHIEPASVLWRATPFEAQGEAARFGGREGGVTLLDIGAVGEIYVAGDGLARGYLGDAALTACKFVACSFAEDGRAYRTGDLGCWAVDGTVQFLGRRDEQVKVRGVRIEPAEIEHKLLMVAGVRDAAVICRDDGAGEKELIAYWCGDPTLAAPLLRSALAAELPDVMVPKAFVRLERLPLTARGKLDRRALPSAPISRSALLMENAQIGPVLPANNTELKMIEIWEEALNVGGIGVSDDFFALGGHSLKVLRVCSLIEKELGVALPFSTVFAARTVRALAQRVLDCARYGEQALDQPVVTLSVNADRAPLFAFPPGTGDALGYAELSRRLSFCTVHAFNFIEAESRLQEYAELIIDIDPAGPYVLFGYSGGGNLAFNVAKELERRARRVSAIVMLDSSRVLEKFHFPDHEVHRLASSFLDADEVKGLVHSIVLRDKATRMIGRYVAALSQTRDEGVVDAEIHLVLAEGSMDTFTDDRGIVITGKSHWSEATRRGLKTYQARGDHAQLLNEPYLEPNSRLIETILSSLCEASNAKRCKWRDP